MSSEVKFVLLFVIGIALVMGGFIAFMVRKDMENNKRTYVAWVKYTGNTNITYREWAMLYNGRLLQPIGR